MIRLTQRELQIGALYAHGFGGTAIAQALGIKKKTVSTHRHRIIRKLNLRSTGELIRYMVKREFGIDDDLPKV